ncbi:hypothetical protein [Cupriavidus sp. UYPR2.512]|uniref:hypothetical protein n=1 Tax=Cupriavidus sp. UYPR2.512 TaxID=1080187 RepID=UPI0012FAE9FA|nr:hypothetical protein [Cupriavidus sp. UYPR2.512]UIF89262.1 hypothetical protein KAF44_30250 [Cupriavidus necator]
MGFLVGSSSGTIAQTIWLVEHGVPPWLIIWLINGQWLVGFVAMFTVPAWPRISWWLFKKRQVAGFSRDAEQRVAQLKIAGVTEIAALATVLNDAKHLYEMARRSAFSTAWSPQPRAFRELCESYSERLEALADQETDPAARLGALQAVHGFRNMDLGGHGGGSGGLNKEQGNAA